VWADSIPLTLSLSTQFFRATHAAAVFFKDAIVRDGLADK